MSKPAAPVRPLRLMAEDALDLKIVSAAVQDALAQVGDVKFEAGPRRLIILLNRYRWETDRSGQAGERVRAALQISGVLAVQGKRLRREPKDAVVSLMALDFHPADTPAGVMTLTFAGGGELSCEVECVDVMLADVSDPWPTTRRPVHALD